MSRWVDLFDCFCRKLYGKVKHIGALRMACPHRTFQAVDLMALAVHVTTQVNKICAQSIESNLNSIRNVSFGNEYRKRRTSTLRLWKKESTELLGKNNTLFETWNHANKKRYYCCIRIHKYIYIFAKHNEKPFSVMSKLKTNCCVRLAFHNVD